MTRDTVTVPREAWAEVRHFVECRATDSGTTRDLLNRIDVAAPSSDPEGGARGDVKGSIADGQQCSEQRPHALSQTTIDLGKLLSASRKVHEWLSNWDLPFQDDDEWAPDLVAFCDAMNNATFEYVRAMKDVAETDANAPGDTSLVSGVSSAPNHQPHAVSQGWQGIETAPKDGTRIIAVGWNWGIVGNDQHVTTVIWRLDREEWCESDDDDDDSACAYLTHWMPLPAPPSPAKTGGVE